MIYVAKELTNQRLPFDDHLFEFTAIVVTILYTTEFECLSKNHLTWFLSAASEYHHLIVAKSFFMPVKQKSWCFFIFLLNDIRIEFFTIFIPKTILLCFAQLASGWSLSHHRVARKAVPKLP